MPSELNNHDEEIARRREHGNIMLVLFVVGIIVLACIWHYRAEQTKEKKQRRAVNAAVEEYNEAVRKIFK